MPLYKLSLSLQTNQKEKFMKNLPFNVKFIIFSPHHGEGARVGGPHAPRPPNVRIVMYRYVS